MLPYFICFFLGILKCPIQAPIVLPAVKAHRKAKPRGPDPAIGITWSPHDLDGALPQCSHLPQAITIAGAELEDQGTDQYLPMQ